MAQAALPEAPLKRKLDGSSEDTDCKRPEQMCPTEIDGNLSQSDGTVACNGMLNLPSSAGASGEAASQATAIGEDLVKGDGKSGKLSVEASGSGSAGVEESEVLGEGEVLEAALEQDDDVDEEQGDEEEEMSEIDTENDSVDEDEEEDAGSDEDSDDDEEDEDEMPTSTSSSLQADVTGKGKGKVIEGGKGKEKVVDFKGKGIMPADKGKGKAVAEGDTAPSSDEDDAGYLSEDPLDEVDLNNILPTRTRRRSSSTHYDFVDQGDEDDDDDDDDSDA